MDSEGRPLVIDSVSLEAIGRGDTQSNDLRKPANRMAPDPPEPQALVDAMFENQWYATPVFERSTMEPGSPIEGPAIIVEATTTTVVELGWRAEITPSSHLLLVRAVPRPGRVEVSTLADPMLLELFNNVFMSVAEQMGAVLQNSAYSVNIKERLDFSCALFDGDGRLVANAPHVPVHLGSMGEAVRAIIRRRGTKIQRGDVYALNDPFAGGTHLPDVTVVTPVFGRSARPRLLGGESGSSCRYRGINSGLHAARKPDHRGRRSRDHRFSAGRWRRFPRSRVRFLTWKRAISSSKSSAKPG